MRFKLFMLMLTLMLLTSCGGEPEIDRLAYQDAALYIEGIFTLDGETVEATLTLDAAEYDESGRMLARNAVLKFGENSIISGVSFELTGGTVYVSSGVLRIPIEDAGVVDGISDMVSLFCIDPGCYYSSEPVELGGRAGERAVYVSGDNRVEVTIDTEAALPTEITATIDGRALAADIKLIEAK